MTAISPDLAAKILAADDKNLVEKVKAGATLNSTERKRVESLASNAPAALPVQAELPLAIDPQLFLFSEEQECEIKGLSTGEGLYRRDPSLYRLTVRLLGQDAPIREIMRLTGLHNRTIQAVREREGECIDTLRKSLGKRALRTAALAVERLEAMIVNGEVKAGELAMATGILIDKGQVLTGGVTARVEAVASEKIEDRLQSMLDSLPKADAAIIPVIAPENPSNGSPAPIQAQSPSLSEEQQDISSTVSMHKSSHVATFETTTPPSDSETPDSLGGEGVPIQGGGYLPPSG